MHVPAFRHKKEKGLLRCASASTLAIAITTMCQMAFWYQYWCTPHWTCGLVVDQSGELVVIFNSFKWLENYRPGCKFQILKNVVLPSRLQISVCVSLQI